MKAQVEASGAEEEQLHGKEVEAEEQLKDEEAKLNTLQDELDRLEKNLDELTRPPGRRP